MFMDYVRKLQLYLYVLCLDFGMRIRPQDQQPPQMKHIHNHKLHCSEYVEFEMPKTA